MKIVSGSFSLLFIKENIRWDDGFYLQREHLIKWLAMNSSVLIMRVVPPPPTPSLLWGAQIELEAEAVCQKWERMGGSWEAVFHPVLLICRRGDDCPKAARERAPRLFCIPAGGGGAGLIRQSNKRAQNFCPSPPSPSSPSLSLQYLCVQQSWLS